ncbi:MAG: glycosyltransferase family 2 protein [Deltaproteobacteria bacterium]
MTPSKPDECLSASVVVVTLNRPEFVRICLRHLAVQTTRPAEIIVVDASPNADTYHVVRDEFPSVRYLKNPLGPGTTGASRNLGLATSSGDVIAFVDDDAYASPDWLAKILEPYCDPEVGGVGGRALNGQPDEAMRGVEEIGRFRADGTLSGNFAADPGAAIEVDHLLGANMSYRRRILVELGGIRDGYPGTCLREETDLSLRVKRAGWKLIFNPVACVQHVAAPYSRGKRFDLRYAYFSQRNHIVLLIRVLGLTSPELRAYIAIALQNELRELKRRNGFGRDALDRSYKATARSSIGGLLRTFVSGAGLIVGVQAGIRQVRLDRKNGNSGL